MYVRQPFFPGLFAVMLQGCNFHLHDCYCVQKSCSSNISPSHGAERTFIRREGKESHCGEGCFTIQAVSPGSFYGKMFSYQFSFLPKGKVAIINIFFWVFVSGKKKDAYQTFRGGCCHKVRVPDNKSHGGRIGRVRWVLLWLHSFLGRQRKEYYDKIKRQKSIPKLPHTPATAEPEDEAREKTGETLFNDILN